MPSAIYQYLDHKNHNAILPRSSNSTSISIGCMLSLPIKNWQWNFEKSAQGWSKKLANEFTSWISNIANNFKKIWKKTSKHIRKLFAITSICNRKITSLCSHHNKVNGISKCLSSLTFSCFWNSQLYKNHGNSIRETKAILYSTSKLSS